MGKLCKIIFLINLGFFNFSYSQHCDALALTMTTPTNVDFVFDSFGKFIGGVTQNGASVLRISVDNSVTLDPDCRWRLVVIVDNNPGAGTPAAEWETMLAYGTSGSNPNIAMLEIRARNACNTALTGNVFVNLLANNGDSYDLIDFNGSVTIPAGSCITNVNGPGSYLTNYNEYHFDIDYRLVPGLGLTPGIYQISLKYILIEEL